MTAIPFMAHTAAFPSLIPSLSYTCRLIADSNQSSTVRLRATSVNPHMMNTAFSAPNDDLWTHKTVPAVDVEGALGVQTSSKGFCMGIEQKQERKVKECFARAWGLSWRSVGLSLGSGNAVFGRWGFALVTLSLTGCCL